MNDFIEHLFDERDPQENSTFKTIKDRGILKKWVQEKKNQSFTLSN